MAKYRVEYDNKEIRSIAPASDPENMGNAILEERTGETIFAIIEAENDDEAQEKAQRLQTELQTGKTKRELTGDDETVDSNEKQ
ncbi:MAG TPA: hypothetical protein PL009_12520 [Flavipsychrobacter sp.]|nr:hypothetical protein [Flavipsychrobacter sp.]